MPFDVAMSLPEIDTLAWILIFGEIKGGEWDFDAMTWRKRRDGED